MARTFDWVWEGFGKVLCVRWIGVWTVLLVSLGLNRVGREADQVAPTMSLGSLDPLCAWVSSGIS
jgi:hypothetical protein